MDSDLIRLIDSRPIEKFITDGLNSGAFGHDAIEILTEIHYAPDAVVRCQDCIHLYSLMDCPLAYVDKQMGIVSARDVDFFCKDGERKETDNG